MFFKQLANRAERVILGMISKKFVAWYAATWLLVGKYITGEAWVLLTLGVFAIQIVQGKIGGGTNAVDYTAGWDTGVQNSQMGAPAVSNSTSVTGRVSVVSSKSVGDEGEDP